MADGGAMPMAGSDGGADGARRAGPRGAEVGILGGDGHVRPLSEIEATAIRLALRIYDGNLSEAARRLGIGRSTLYRKLAVLRGGG